MRTQKTLKFIDLFAGAGGLSTGLELAGFECLYANEVSPIYSETLKNNHPDTIIDTQDIRKVKTEQIRRDLNLKKGELDLLVGGPPCQGFSVNAPKRDKSDPRNHLFMDFLRFTEEFLPSTVIVENVPGIISFENGETVNAILDSFKNLGYQVDVRILYAPHYGVPQMRWRTIFVANRQQINPLLMFPIPKFFALGRANFRTKHLGTELTLSDEAIKKFAFQKYNNIGDAISDLPPIENGSGYDETTYPNDTENDYQSVLRFGSNKIFNHRCAKLGPANLVRLPHIPQGGSWRNIPHDLLPKGMQKARRSDHTKRYGRLEFQGLGSTILTKCDPHWGAYIHPKEDRVLSVREAARIQSFPDKVIFSGTLTEQYEQVGNAVPPLLAKAIGERIKSIMLSDDTNHNEKFNSPWLPTQHAFWFKENAS